MLRLISCLFVMTVCSMTQGDLVTDLSAKDRDIQANAVRLIGESEEDHTDALVALWDSTDRRDVRAHVVDAFVEMEERGFEGLIRLMSTHAIRGNQDTGSMVTNGLIRLGEPAVLALQKNLLDGNPQIEYVLVRVAGAKKHDLTPFAIELSRHPDILVADRIRYRLQQLLPVVDRSTWAIRRADARADGNADIKSFYNTFPVWTEEQRLTHRTEFAKYSDDLLTLLNAEDFSLLAAVCEALGANKIADADTLERLNTLITLPSRPQTFQAKGESSFTVNTAAAKAYLTLHPDPAQAVRDVVAFSESHPMNVCIALAKYPPEHFDDESIRTLVRIAPKANGREENYCFDLFVIGRGVNKPTAIGLRAVPVLEEMIQDPKEPGAATAAVMLGMMLDTVPYSQALIDYHRQVFLADAEPPTKFLRALALLRIEPSNTAAIEHVQRTISGLRDPITAWAASFEDYARKNMDHEWVAGLLSEIVSDPQHPLHDRILRYKEVSASAIEKLQSKLVADLREVTARDLYRAYAFGDLDAPPDFRASNDEAAHRQRARDLLRKLDRPDPEVIAAIIEALHDSLAVQPEPNRGDWRSRDPKIKMMSRRHVAWQSARYEAQQNSYLLGNIILRNPDLALEAYSALEDTPLSLALVLSAYVSQEDRQGRGHLSIPDDASDSLISAAIDGLDMIVDPSYGFEDHVKEHAGAALVRLKGQTQADVDHVIEQIYFGSGKNPMPALVALGEVRPWKTEYLDIIREYLRSGSGEMWHSALKAAESAGPHAEPLVDELIAIGLVELSSNRWFWVQRALNAIAPDDPRVVEFNAKVDAWSAEQRRQREASQQ